MKPRTPAVISAVVEAATGFALIANPSFVVHLLIGSALSDGGVAIGRVCGFGLLSLGLACWPSGRVANAQAISGLFTYNLLAALYIGFLGAVGGFAGFLLWPACVLHGVLAFLLARPAYQAIRREGSGVEEKIENGFPGKPVG
jgi:hypothetical protein